MKRFHNSTSKWLFEHARRDKDATIVPRRPSSGAKVMMGRESPDDESRHLALRRHFHGFGVGWVAVRQAGGEKPRGW
jgi:hypothetical protein